MARTPGPSRRPPAAAAPQLRRRAGPGPLRLRGSAGLARLTDSEPHADSESDGPGPGVARGDRSAAAGVITIMSWRRRLGSRSLVRLGHGHVSQPQPGSA
eukprot:3054978-Rhodomonas_salina.2